MGQAGGHRSLCGPGVPEQCDSDENGKPDHEQPPQGPKDSPKQKCAGHRRQRLRQDPLLVEAEFDADAQLSYVVTDPKGTILVECGKMLQRGTPKMRPKLGKDHQPVKDRHGNPVYETVKDKNGKVVYEPYLSLIHIYIYSKTNT